MNLCLEAILWRKKVTDGTTLSKAVTTFKKKRMLYESIFICFSKQNPNENQSEYTI